jgi:hypothetical protein
MVPGIEVHGTAFLIIRHSWLLESEGAKNGLSEKPFFSPTLSAPTRILTVLSRPLLSYLCPINYALISLHPIMTSPSDQVEVLIVASGASLSHTALLFKRMIAAGLSSQVEAQHLEGFKALLAQQRALENVLMRDLNACERYSACRVLHLT